MGCQDNQQGFFLKFRVPVGYFQTWRHLRQEKILVGADCHS